MMKKFITLLVLVILLITTVSCNSRGDDSSSSQVNKGGEQSVAGEKEEQSEESSGNTSEKYAEIFEKYEDNPEMIDRAIYAQAEGISINESVSRFEIMNMAGFLGEALEKSELDNFAGFWIQHNPRFCLVAAFTENGEETIAPYREEYPELAEFIEVCTVQYTYTELLNAQKKVSNAIEKLGAFAGSCTYVQYNSVEVYVTNMETVDEAIRDGKLNIPDCIEIIIVDNPVEEE
ncbi:hypothetical protein ACFLYN_02815 [Chloroflexota bacterium]